MEREDPYVRAHLHALGKATDDAWWRGFAWGCIVGALLAVGVAAIIVGTLGRPCLP